jgi:hypothetical protein
MSASSGHVYPEEELTFVYIIISPGYQTTGGCGVTSGGITGGVSMAEGGIKGTSSAVSAGTIAGATPIGPFGGLSAGISFSFRQRSHNTTAVVKTAIAVR